ncbi:hypothetical protein ACEQ8H_000713 [Pleosporales sp. CAS-2024a]
MAAQEHAPLQLAQILSDLVSLRVCDPAAALALVSARPDAAGKETRGNEDDDDDNDDVDVARAKELVKLHYGVKEKQKRGELSRGLEEARKEVERALGG